LDRNSLIKSLFTFFIMTILGCSCLSAFNSGIIEEYKDTLKIVLDSIKDHKSISDISIIKSLTNDTTQFRLFYESTNTIDFNDNKAIYSLLELVKTRSLSNINILYKYIQLVEFVDGEFAEGYYSDLSYIAENSLLIYCEVYFHQPKSIQNKLIEISRICK
jgi:hypothetical protein